MEKFNKKLKIKKLKIQTDKDIEKIKNIFSSDKYSINIGG